MKEMEDEIDVLKEGSQAGSVDGQLSGDNKGELEDREHELGDRENSLLMVRSEARTLIFFLTKISWILTFPFSFPALERTRAT
jgi:hypothetical protein